MRDLRASPQSWRQRSASASKEGFHISPRTPSLSQPPATTVPSTSCSGAPPVPPQCTPPLRTIATFPIIGSEIGLEYGLGWRGGKWYANRKFRKEQMKLLGQIKPKRWQLKFLRRPLIRSKSSENAVKPSEVFQKDLPAAHNSGEMNRPC
ncbi:hypothetical protein TEA_003174 [Camellia sinensis var. sinensis]|uniref:Uncharacterized protein n=1 Tax=Camellia sinensis var. sinensis TaxID=542762 RepID=A0A4S4EVU2_CAMSN|nr:hypothetical protein TEA_003174 [Camellia sinensis var. sinensis]